MIPIRDSIRSGRFPAVTVSIVAVNAVVFVYELLLDQTDLARFFLTFGVIPARFLAGGVPGLIWANSWVPLVTSVFIHGGWFHIIGNMLYLWVFGDNVEERLGRTGFLLFYLAAGVLANLSHVLANPSSTMPAVGASGAVAGVLGAYFLMFPGSRVLALIPLGFFLHLAEVPAVLFLFLWFFLQMANGLANLGVVSQATAGVAWWAHIGGFVTGMLVVLLLPRRQRNRV
ncbi:MAG: rhomboid family intramembrane serine protease [Bacillota bacterium]